MPIKVMVVDDTDHVRRMLATMLELDGFEVVAMASGGAEAIERITDTFPDVVVMDYRMPEMDGLTATRRLREIAPAVPVILYTAYIDDRLEADAHEAGAALCLAKAEGLENLEREISKMCIELMN